MKYPKAYLITFTTYGTWLHGSEKGSADKNNNRYGFPYIPPTPAREAWENDRSSGKVILARQDREIVLNSICEKCALASWNLLAAHIRSNHLHAVISGQCLPEKMIKSLKSFVTKRLREYDSSFKDIKIWTTNGSRKYLWDAVSVKRAVDYTLNEQGRAMSVFPKR